MRLAALPSISASKEGLGNFSCCKPPEEEGIKKRCQPKGFN